MTAVTLEKISEELDLSPRDLFTFDEETNDEMYAYIMKRLDFIKTDYQLLKIMYNVAKSLF